MVKFSLLQQEWKPKELLLIYLHYTLQKKAEIEKNQKGRNIFRKEKVNKNICSTVHHDLDSKFYHQHWGNDGRQKKKEEERNQEVKEEKRSRRRKGKWRNGRWGRKGGEGIKKQE